MTKRCRKILVLAVIFTLTFVNYGLPLQVIASEGESFFSSFSFFKKNEIALDAYFDDSEEKVLNVNDTAILTLEVSPLIEGYLKSGVLKFNLTNGNDDNFKIKSVTIEDKEETEVDEVDKLLLQENKKAESTEETTEVKENESVENTASESEMVDEVEQKNVEGIEDTDTDNAETEDKNNALSSLLNNSVVSTLTDNGKDTKKDENEVVEEEVETDDSENVIEDSEETAEPETTEEVQNTVSEDEVVEESKDLEIDKTEELEEDILIGCYEVSLSNENENEIELKNIIDSTKIFVEIEYKQSEQINAVDLYSNIEIILEGNYINKKLETVEVTKTKEVTLGWEYSKEIEITSTFAKVSPFTVGENFGTIVENIVTVERNIEDTNYLPIKETNIKIEIPKINDKLPIAVSVSANKLMATLGKELEGNEFSKANWSYNEETGILEIKVTNKNMLAGKGEDKFDIICRYEDYVEDASITLNKNVSVKVEEYSSNENKIQEKSINEEEEKEVVAGELMTYSAVETEEKINKGKINANYYIDAGYKTEFSNIVNVTVLTSDILEEIEIEPTKEAYKLEDGSELDATNDVMYAGVKFNYAEIKEMLEQGSTIDLLDENDNVFHTITKDVPSCSIVFSENINTVKVRINKVKVNGNLSIEFVKTIGKSQYSTAEFDAITSVTGTVKATVKYVGFEDTFQLPEINLENKLTNSITNVNFTMNKSYLSAIAENENVEFKIDFINNFETSDIYKNPTFEIVFPVYVKEVKINNIYTLYQNGLEIANYYVFEENGIQKLRIELVGTQAGFNFSNITNGTNIILNTNIVIDEITPQRKDEIQLYYYNEAVTNYQTEANWSISKEMPTGIIKDTNGYDSVTFEYQTPTGLIAINSITNYDGTGATIKSIEQGEVIKTIAIKGESHIATMELSVLNNTGNQCLETVLLGRIPFKGNKDVGTNQDLGTNVDTIMKSLIIPDELNSNEVTIYYSSNKNADKDLNKDTNGWNTSFSPVENIKSFMIVVNGTVEPGAILKFKYDFEIPANLGYEVKMAGSFGAFYNEVTDTLVKYETSVADKVGLITEAGAKYEATMSVDIGDGAEIGEARYLTYTVKVTNTGSIDLNNIRIENEIPNLGTIKNAEETIKGAGIYHIDQLLVGETKEKEILVKTSNIPEDIRTYAMTLPNIHEDTDEDGNAVFYVLDENNQKNYITELPDEFYIENSATVYVEDTITGITTNTVRNKLVQSKLDITVEEFRTVADLNSGDEFKYIIDVYNISNETIDNIVIEDILPNELTYLNFEQVDTEYIEEFDKEANKLKVSVGSLEPLETARFFINCEVSMKNIGKATISNSVTVTADDNIKEYGNVVYSTLLGPELTVTQETDKENNSVLEMDKFQILININNRGEADSKTINLNVEIPESLQVLDITSEGQRMINYTVNDNMLSGNLYLLGAHDTATLVITAKPNPLDEGETNRVLDINTKVSENYIGELEINSLAITVLDNPNRDLTEEEQKAAEDAVTVVDPTPTDDYKEDIENAKNNGTNSTSNGTTETSSTTDTTETTEKVQEPVQSIQTYKISGKVWKDDDKDNMLDTDEDGISKVQVSLYEGNSKVKSVITDSLGKYRLTEIEPGNYTIVFTYDGETYTAAQYRAVNVADDQNSDAIESEEGIAVTDTINLTNSDLEVDLGLQNRDEFDMIVNKYIVKSIVSKNGKETVETYDNKQLAKLEIKSKELKNTTIQLEYKIVITNNGNVSGKVGMVKDYLPASLTFDESKNSGWQLGSDGVLYNETLKDTTIKAGETKELKLVLNKVMTEDNTGTISNKVEITDLSTEKTLKENSDNNIATQEMIITISTGRTISIVIMITLLIVCSVVIYGIKTGKIKRTYK